MLIKWLFLFIIAFLPPLVYVIWIRNTERYHREPWGPLLLSFIWGATIAIIASLILGVVFEVSLATSFHDYTSYSFFAAIVIAPFVEEFTKPLALGLRTVRREIDELEDGLIYGAVAGLGFSATENLFYGMGFLSEGMVYFIILISMRSFGGCLLHASASALTGYGYGKTLMKHASLIRVLPYFILAILIHSFYNFLVSFQMIGIFAGLIAAFLFVAIASVLKKPTVKKAKEA